MRKPRSRWGWNRPRAGWSMLAIPLVSLMLLASLAVAAPAVAASVGSVSLSANSTSLNVGTSAVLTATVLDTNNNPMSKVTVTFTVTGVNSPGSYNVVARSGQAVLTIPGTNVGSDTITAEAGNVTSNPVTVTWSAPTATAISISPTTLTANINTSQTFTATVTGAGSVPVQGVTVNFSVSGTNSVSGSDTTDSNGHATFSYSSTVTGSDTVTATISGTSISASSSVTWVSGNLISLTPTSLTASVNTVQTFTATVTTPSAVAVPGVTVVFTVTGVNPTSGSDVTDSNGQATFSYAGSNVGTDTVTATISGTSTSDSTLVTWVAAANISISPTSLTATTSTSQTFTATVTDTNGNDLPGVTVNFTVTGVNPTSGSDTTDVNGQATFTYTGTTSGTDTVTATIAGTTTSATSTVTWVGTGAITLSPTNPVIVTGTTASIVATVKSTSNVLLVGVTVTFSVTGVNPTTSSATTNSSGQATLTYLGSNVGTDTVTVSVSGLSSASTTIRWVTGPLSLTLAASSTSLTTGNTVTITATLRDGNSNAISGVPVKFTVTGANPTSGTDTTDGSGNAHLSYTGTNAGTDTITAFADLNNNGTQVSGEPTGSVTVTWSGSTTPPPPPPPSGAFAPAQPAAPKAGCTYFVVTHHNLCAGFQSYWNTFGGLATYGYPLTEEFVENGLTVQYFERARFEWHPGVWPSHFDVLLGLVGDEVTAGRATQAPFVPTGAKPGCTYFAATGHNLCAGFGAFWNMFGGLAAYGMPISEEFTEQNPDTGQVYTVQYFERARFEWHPGADPVHFDVELGRLGAAELKGH